jgi:peroxiredoxin
MALLLLLVVAACSGPGEAVPEGINEGHRARDFKLETLDGQETSLSDYEDSVVLINFWATWCAPCRAEVPDLEATYQKYQDDGFVVLGVNLEEPPETIVPFVEEFDVTYPILLDRNGELMKTYRAMGLPMSVLVDREGMIQVRHVGFLTASQLEDYLANLVP